MKKLARTKTFFTYLENEKNTTEAKAYMLLPVTRCRNKIVHVEIAKFGKNKWTKEILPDLTNFHFEFMSRSILYKVKMKLFVTNVPILCPLKTSKKLLFAGLFRGYKMVTSTRNALVGAKTRK